MRQRDYEFAVPWCRYCGSENQDTLNFALDANMMCGMCWAGRDLEAQEPTILPVSFHAF